MPHLGCVTIAKGNISVSKSVFCLTIVEKHLYARVIYVCRGNSNRVIAKTLIVKSLAVLDIERRNMWKVIKLISILRIKSISEAYHIGCITFYYQF